jgi:geranylgeranyl pyrophosphate synthase
MHSGLPFLLHTRTFRTARPVEKCILVGQLLDLEFTALEDLTEAQVLQIQTYKTAFYTFRASPLHGMRPRWGTTKHGCRARRIW